MQKFLKASNIIICVFGLAIFSYLTFHSMSSTWYMIPASSWEIPVSVRDSLAGNLIVLALFVAVLVFLTFLSKKKDIHKKTVLNVVLFLSASFQLILGTLHVFGADRVPGGDQASIIGAAESFLNGDYSLLRPENYIGIYPQQLGQVVFIEALLSVFKSADYHLLQFIMVIINTCSVYVIYHLIRELTGSDVLTMIGTLIAGFNPLTVFYTTWVYGDLPSIFLMLSASLMLIRYSRRKKMHYLIFGILFITLGFLVRKNTLIFIIAFFILTIIKGIYSKDKKLIVAGVCAVIIPFLVFKGICMRYEKVSGIPHSTGLPAASFLYIGLSENNGHCGWYSAFPMDYYNNGCDTEKTSEVIMEKVRNRFDGMVHEPGYIKVFYGYKILSQWNEPLYQAAYYNLGHGEVHMEKVVSLVDRVMAYHFDKYVFFEDKIQLIIFAGMFLYFLFSFGKSSDLTWHVLALTIIGGFLFSIIWEAKARYILPYYMLMFPASMRGYHMFLELLSGVRKKD